MCYIRRQGYFDMQLVATMLVHEIPIIVTENSGDFSLVAEITTLNPFSD
jgi:predicted nucleic acid-binding protein